jgi:hypothetical protein
MEWYWLRIQCFGEYMSASDEAQRDTTEMHVEAGCLVMLLPVHLLVNELNSMSLQRLTKADVLLSWSSSGMYQATGLQTYLSQFVMCTMEFESLHFPPQHHGWIGLSGQRWGSLYSDTQPSRLAPAPPHVDHEPMPYKCVVSKGNKVNCHSWDSMK